LPRLQRLAVVAPGDSALPFAPVERDYLLSLAGNGREVERVPATFLDVVDALAGSRHDGWHFTGHGAARDANPDRAAIYLEGDEPLMPEDLSGTVGNLRRWQPLVFLNACQVGRGGMSLTGVGGWARRFLDAGASAFVSTYWSVQDRPANEFAQAFYGRLLGGMPIGVAALEARAAIKPHRDATWLAYTVFADPLASLEA
jgi:CHAT domain-containing protein